MIRFSCFETPTKTVANVAKGRERGIVERRQITFLAEPRNEATNIQEPTQTTTADSTYFPIFHVPVVEVKANSTIPEARFASDKC